MGKSRNVGVSAYRVSISDETRALTYERERLRSTSPRVPKDNYDIKKELALKEEAAVAKMIVGGSRYNADKLAVEQSKRSQKLKAQASLFKGKSNAVLARMQTRAAYGPNVIRRNMKTVIGPDGGIYATGVSLDYDIPTGSSSSNAYSDFQKLQSLRQLAMSAHNPGGADFQMAAQAQRLGNSAFDRYQAQVKSSRGSVGEQGLWDAEVRQQERAQQAKRAVRQQELRESVVFETRPGEAQLLEPLGAKSNADAVTLKVAHTGYELGNIPGNFKKQTHMNMVYQSAYDRYVNTKTTTAI
jgi:hypothetical protein